MSRAGLRTTLLAVILGAAMVLAPPASAHTRLKEASPAVGSTVAPPDRIILTYADPVIVPAVVVTDAAGGRHEAGKAQAVDNKVTQPIGSTLQPGAYTVAWRVVASDGHPVTGVYKFTVKGTPGAVPLPSAPAAGPGPAGDDASAGTGWWWIGLAVVVVAGVAAGVALLRRRSGTGKGG